MKTEKTEYGLVFQFDFCAQNQNGKNGEQKWKNQITGRDSNSCCPQLSACTFEFTPVDKRVAKCAGGHGEVCRQAEGGVVSGLFGLWDS